MKIKSAGSLLAASLILSLAAQSHAQTVLDGVYTDAQAQRGSRTYLNICSECHEGGEPDADPLFGIDFVDRWREAPLSFLHGFFSNNMPGDEPGSLAPDVYIDVLAFLLRENGYPAGTKDLTLDQLDTTLLIAPGGPQALPPSSLVRVAGCLAEEEGGTWTLVAATAPARVRTADETTPEELALSAAVPAGSLIYKLRNAGDFAAPEKFGQKVQAKGVLVSQGAGATISVLSLEATGVTCE